MAFVQKRRGKRGVRYVATWTDDQGKQREKTFARKTDADDHVTLMEAAKLKGEYVDTSSKITVAEYARQYAANRPHRDTTAIRIKSLIDRHINGTKLGAQRLSAVRPSDTQAWIADRSRVLSAGTLRLLVQFARSVFAAAVLDRIIASNPLPPRLSLPRSEKPDIDPLTVDQVSDLADAMQPRCRALIITQAGLGLRIAELLALRVQDVDFLRGSVKIDAQLTQDSKRRVDTKTPKSRRTLPLPAIVADALAAHIAEFPPAEDGTIFTTAQGNLYRQEHYQARIFRPAVGSAGLPDDTTPHDLRHHFASVMLRATGDPVAVARAMGNTPAMVLKTYGHMMPGAEDRMRRAIDGAWADNEGLASESLTSSSLSWHPAGTIPDASLLSSAPSSGDSQISG